MVTVVVIVVMGGPGRFTPSPGLPTPPTTVWGGGGGCWGMGDVAGDLDVLSSSLGDGEGEGEWGAVMQVVVEVLVVAVMVVVVLERAAGPVMERS